MDIQKQILDYTVSLDYDRRLYHHDIRGSKAHARMLCKQGIISDDDATLICEGLGVIEREIDEDKFPWDVSLEDIHMNIESRLTQNIGAAGGRLHTGRSRNDQISLDLRMYTKDVIETTLSGIKKVQSALLELADANSNVIMPGYTHLQRAQPVLFAHHMLAYFRMFTRDGGRFKDCYARVDVMPLGSGALAGVPYPTDREFLATELGFSAVTNNSMDAVSDRDFLLEFQAAASICMMHFSRLSEEMVIWSSREFGFVKLDEAYTTGSSIMPQKRNPDFAELARGKTGRVYGNLFSLFTVLKGLPLTYNRDLQEDKEGFFDTVDTLLATLNVYEGMLGSLKVIGERMSEFANESYMLATDMADYLVSKEVPFREAHGIMRNLCDYCEGQGKELKELSLSEYHAFSNVFEDDVYNITAWSSIEARDNLGGTAPSQVEQELGEARRQMEGLVDAR